MLIGIPKETKNNEHRVSISPQGVREILNHGHQIVVESEAGHFIGYDDNQYREAGALVLDTSDEVYERAEMIVKVKEPQANECSLIKEGQIIFSYLHLAAEPKIANALIDSGCIAISYETVEDEDGRLPLLAPMSEVAGRVSVQAGAYFLQSSHGGRGVLLGGVPGVNPGKVTIIGAGVVGTNAAVIAAGLGADVTVLDRSVRRMRELDQFFGNRIKKIFATADEIEQNVYESDLVIGAVLVPGAAAPKILTSDMVRRMKRGAVLVDVSIDQGGMSETSRPTTHDEPVFIEEGVVHYCVTNIPSAVSRSSSKALENSILPYVLKLADRGYRASLGEDEHFRKGLNLYRGRITHEAVANDLNHSYVPPSSFLGDGS